MKSSKPNDIEKQTKNENEEGDSPIQSGSNDPDSVSAYLLPAMRKQNKKFETN